MKQGNECECETDAYEFIDVFGIGNLTDSHLECAVTEDELTKRLQDAVEMSRQMGNGTPPGILQDLAIMTAPKMTWEDFITIHIGNKKQSGEKNDWGSPRTRSLSFGMYLPKKRTIEFTALILIDRSGSVSNEQANLGLSQLQVLGESLEGFVVCFDTKPYYSRMTKIDSATADELIKIQYTGGGGTCIASSLYSYEEEIGPVDMVIVITDGAIFDLAELTRLGIPNSQTEYLWLLTERNIGFKPSFGKVYALNNE